ncbi:3'(2'),5'-bisphosphate nucleotidase CysQ [Dongia soli]|uniref:3'(2'),5'-bisphosphate nucleotidase CysQ n=1 Tax=Dongia soli TaxID=600628 RepID=A0ABU5ECY9_9PROT|nr:3'(2'),5'-bisphosphate nucleotidase CysQ [Dongia soli]MDY0884230.1 3'(2'),5'-bisphosphate nucleotidase CysQ [Dongia soli]
MTMGNQPADQLTVELERIALAAGEVILRIYESDFAHQHKSDKSPVTEADVAAEAVIAAELHKLTPEIPLIAEEAAAVGGLPAEAAARFWLVDPLDGTKEFIARNGEFTVNIALIEGGSPKLGIVHVPVLGQTYGGDGKTAWRRVNKGAYEEIRTRAVPTDGAVMTISRSHAAKELVKAEEMGVKIADTLVAGSSLKFCRLAEGVADIYPRFGPTMEWDTAAGHAVLVSAGGSVRQLDGRVLPYGKPGFLNPHFIARGRD